MYSGDSSGVILIWNCAVTDGKRKSKAVADGNYILRLLVAVMSSRLTVLCMSLTLFNFRIFVLHLLWHDC